MNWTKGYSAHWRVHIVNPSTWADAEEIAGVTAVTIERDCSSTIPLLESASIDIDMPIEDNFEEVYLRVIMDAHQNGGAERIELGTFLCSAKSGTIMRNNNETHFTGRSVLYPAETRLITTGRYAPKGVDGAAYAADLLRECVAAPVRVQGGFTLSSYVVFDIGMTYLECVWLLLDAGSYIMQIDGDGTINIVPKPYEPILLLDDAGVKLLHPSLKYEIDWSDIPNRYTAIEGSQVAVALNDDPNSYTSTVARGYILDRIDRDPIRIDGESLSQYASRMLEEESIVFDVKTYTREYYPGIYPFSIVRGSLGSVGLDGDMRVISQSLTCGKGVTINERAQKEVYLWTR